MGLLNRLFSSAESAAKEIEADDEAIIKHWKIYLGTVSGKKEIIGKLSLDNNFQNNLKKLKELLDLELVDISGEEKEESELISDLESIEHSKKIKRVHRLEQCLGYAETKYKYVYELLNQLHSVLKSQMHLVAKLQTVSKDIERLISHLKLQLELELEVLNKINEIKTFHNLFLALVKGEHIIKTMDSKEKRLLKKMQKGVGQIFAKELREGITYEWAITVLNALDDKIHDAMVYQILDSYEHMDFEFVNRIEFVDLVRGVIQAIRKRKVSEQMINVFVHLFREWYNNEIN